ncbi:UDP-3-O-(3-hydroxymyristoyl)glucosamine N-acyltransferase [Poriferisphaera sp. WC338]|uniref:UDP-3-O-(3-hydroxymyristoyl)glucosamine N-acyltransferase n=1 Tax=Poriferisphaera sp. WC338 TaxID=3425129 RepID=UPI003D81260F
MTQTIQQIADLVQGKIVGSPDLEIHSLEELELADNGQLTFVGHADFAEKWPESKASAALVNEDIELEPGGNRALIFVPNADLAMGRVLSVFAPEPVQANPGVHPSAIVDSSATLGENVAVGAGCFVGPNVVLGSNTILHANVTLLDHATIGSDCVIWPGAVVRERCIVGNRTEIHSNVTLGADGFGYRPNQNKNGVYLEKIPQIGNVVIGDDCEIGAGTAIDRAKFSSTVVGNGTKIDNLCQIGHNVRIGNMCAISGSCGIAGSVIIGNGVTMGGMCALKDHITINDGAILAGASQVMSDVPAGQTWAGSPAREYGQAVREYAMIRKLPDLYKQVKRFLKS